MRYLFIIRHPPGFQQMKRPRPGFQAGDDSALHVIVFDEIDAFTRERGSLSGDTSGIRDSVVNQLP